MQRVLTAKPYVPFAMSSLGSASGMLIRQHNFPDTYDETLDQLTNVDHDRALSWSYQRVMDCFKRYTGDAELGEWARAAAPERILALLIEIVDEPAVNGLKWNGFRILGTVHRANGSAVWTLELCAVHPQSGTKTYSTSDAPNVKQTYAQVRYGR